MGGIETEVERLHEYRLKIESQKVGDLNQLAKFIVPEEKPPKKKKVQRINNRQ